MTGWARAPKKAAAAARRRVRLFQLWTTREAQAAAVVGAAAAAVAAYLVAASQVVVAAQLNFAVAAAAVVAYLVVVSQVVVAAAAAVAAYLVAVRQAVVSSLAPRQPRATLRRPRSHCSCGAPTAATASLPGSERAARARAPRCAPWPAAGSCCVTMMRRAALHRTRSEVARAPRFACVSAVLANCSLITRERIMGLQLLRRIIPVNIRVLSAGVPPPLLVTCLHVCSLLLPPCLAPLPYLCHRTPVVLAVSRPC